jgi:hypothetical protein
MGSRLLGIVIAASCLLGLVAAPASAVNSEQLWRVPLRDDLQRNDPPSGFSASGMGAGKWSTPSAYVSSRGGAYNSGGKLGYGSPSGVSGAYWNAQEFVDKGRGVAVEATLTAVKKGESVSLWMNQPSPTTLKSGYQLNLVALPSVSSGTAYLYKWTNGTATLLASSVALLNPGMRYALVEKNGELSAWLAPGSTFINPPPYGPGEIIDATPFKGGFAGLEVTGSGPSLADFSAGPVPTARPILNSTSPASPNPSTTPSILGEAEAGTTVRLYTNSSCTGSPAATGSAASLASPGLSVTVTKKSTTNFYATATNSEAETSPCSTSFITYTTPPQIYWGAWMSGEVYKSFAPGLGTAPWDNETLEVFQSNKDKYVGAQHAGRKVSLIHFGQPAPWLQKFAAGPLELTSKAGSIPFVDMGLGESGGKPVTLTEIKSGARDAELKEWAKAVNAYGKPLFFRWAWEMNGTWFPWGKEAAEKPALYVEAWRHFHMIAEEQKATNLTWVWCPNVSFKGSTPLGELYPGDAYVDWTCMDGYNWGSTGWTSFSGVFSTTYGELLSLAPTKPVMIGETASAEVGGSKAAWIEAGFAELPSKFPKIEAVNWFNWNIVEEGVERPWPIETSAASATAFSKAINAGYFAENTFGSLTSLTKIKPIE